MYVTVCCIHIHCTLKIRPAQLSCLGSSVGRKSAWYAVCHRLESHLRHIIYSLESDLSSNVHVHVQCMYMYMYVVALH